MKLSEIRQIMQTLEIAPGDLDPKNHNHYLKMLGFEPGTIYQELEMESRYVDTHLDVSYDNANVHLHSHSFFEFLYCCNNCNAEYLIGTKRYRLQKGDILLIPPGISHRPLLPDHMTQPYKRYVLWINAEFFYDLLKQFPDDRLYTQTGVNLIRTAGTAWESLGALFQLGVQESEKRKIGWEAFVAANTIQLVIQFRRAILDNTTKPMKAEKPELLDSILAYIEEHLADKITLADVAKYFWVSQSTISQTFRNKLGVSFYRCVTQRRLIAAKTLILEGQALENVSEQVGFSDYSTFYRAFRQEYGVSPRQFRRLQEPSDKGSLHD